MPTDLPFVALFIASTNPWSTWATFIIAAGAVVGALSVLWTKVLNPLRKAGNRAEQMYPLLVELTATFAAHPHYFKVLDDIAEQFKSNHGSSLMDVVRSLQASAEENKRAAEVLKIGVEAARVLAERDREQLMRLIILLDRLDAKVSGGRGALDRIELDRANVAHELVVATTKVEGVATDLARAQEAVDGVAARLDSSEAAAEAHRAKVAEDLAVAKLAVDQVAAELETNGRRLAAARELVAANLLKAQAAVDGIASDVAAGHVRADAATGPPGDSADAAARSADPETATWLAQVQRDRRQRDPVAEQAWRDSGLPERRAR